MNLLSLKRELEQLKALAASRRGSGCVCEYVEVSDDIAPEKEQERILERNRACYAQYENRDAHVGWRSVVIPSNPFK